MKKSFKIAWIVGLTTQSGGKLVKYLVIEKIAAIMAEFNIPAFSISDQVGYWKGIEEISLQISLINTDSISELIIEEIANKFRIEFNQECILTTKQAIEYNFI